RSKQQVKDELNSILESNNPLSLTQLVEDSDDDYKQQSNNIVPKTLEQWDVFREYEQQQLTSIKLLTKDEMLNIEQWVLDLDKVYEALRYQMSRRIWQTITYLQDEEQLWHHLSSVRNTIPVGQFSSAKSSSININSSLKSALSITMAREIVKSPTYFCGTEDDVIEWLEKL
ncbi:unnamed protein product, partial [Rotaria magnacalcarata]